MDRLNEMQKQAVTAKEDSVVVIAGAGSGKTTVVTKRIANLVMNHDALPEDVLAITFTNKAANEMKERILEELGPFSSNMWVMTFHSFSLRLIRYNIEHVANLKSDFLIIDDLDKKSIIKQIIKRLQLCDIVKVKSAMYAISNAKSKVSYLSEVKNFIYYDYFDIYKEYAKHLIDNNAIDFDDILLIANELMDNEQLKAYYSVKFKYIHVDEFQDTSKVQFELLKKLKSENNNIFIVGDVDQSIYGWRGAVVDNLLNIETTFPNTRVIKLEQNYRSSKNIITCANKLIEQNINRIEKTLWTDNMQGAKVSAYRFVDAYRESDFVMQEIKMQHEMGKNLNEYAILYRANYLSKKIEEKLMQNQIPYKIYGGVKFYERMEIKDIIAYIRLIFDHSDNISFSRVINVPKRKVGDVTQAKYRNFALENNLSHFQAAEQLASAQVKDFVEIVKSYKERLEADFELEFDNLLFDIKYQDHLVSIDGEDKMYERMDNVHELKESFINALNNGSTINDYLNELALYTDHGEDSLDGVVLSTIHGVKGLEFDHVYMIGMSEDIFPRTSHTFKLDEIEEERRVCYVGVTRARKKLVLTNFTFDFKGDFLDNSRFISEMDVEVIEKDDAAPKGFIF